MRDILIKLIEKSKLIIQPGPRFFAVQGQSLFSLLPLSRCELTARKIRSDNYEARVWGNCGASGNRLPLLEAPERGNRGPSESRQRYPGLAARHFLFPWKWPCWLLGQEER